MTAILGVIADQRLDTMAKIKSFFSAEPYCLRVVDDEKNNLYLLKYDQVKTDFAYPAAQEARGIIFEKGTNRVVCYPFAKFFNAGEKHAAEIDWSTASVQHKYDGSIIKLYWLAAAAATAAATTDGEPKGQWMVATNGTTDARNAPADEQRGTTFYDLFKDAEKTAHLDYARLDTDCTYMFELMHPDQLIVVRYKTPRLIHIGTRNNKTFRESYESIGVEQAETFPLRTLSECRDAAARLGPSQEGFVVCDASWRRVKIKGSVYLKLHHTLTGNSLTDEEVAAQLILQGEQSELAAYEGDERIAGICKHIVTTDAKLDQAAARLEKIWNTVMAPKPTSRKEIALAFQREAGVCFPLMMSRVSYESKTPTTTNAVPVKVFFRTAVVEMHRAATITRTHAREFLEFLKTTTAEKN